MKTQASAIIDKLLTNVSNQLVPEGYISEMILPELKVKERTGKIGKYGNQHLRIVNTVTGGKQEYATVDSVVRSDSTYTIVSHALKDLVTQEDLDNVEKPFDAEQDAVTALVTHLWLGKEKSLADTLTDPAVITQTVQLSGTSQYNDFTNSTPLTDFITARTTVRSGCGLPPNGAAMDWDVAETLRYHPDMLDALGFKEQRPGGLNDTELARALNVKRVLVAEAVFNNSVLGQADSIVPVWGKHIVFFRAPQKAALRQKTLGYRVQLASRKPRQVFKSFPDEPIGARKIMVLDDYDQILVDVDCAYLIEDAIA